MSACALLRVFYCDAGSLNCVHCLIHIVFDLGRIFQERIALQLQHSPRIVPRNFHMHAMIAHAQSGSDRSAELMQCYFKSITTPYYQGTPQQYLDEAAHVVCGEQPHQARSWALDPTQTVLMSSITEPVSLYPQSARMGISICSCSS